MEFVPGDKFEFYLKRLKMYFKSIKFIMQNVKYATFITLIGNKT